ncbi:thiolase C-terminal domain-containing protein [Phenylobacterium sp.]|uniref:thiolase C-terminal domain-containing protein n=1 Tax=Phenylobacterium sp. TaxID=1871053 RepID=UPI0028993794|nr:transporter [Phenylobacterium sp.]
MKPETPCIVGIGQTVYTRWNAPLESTELGLGCEAIVAAASDAGMAVRDIDGVTSFGGDGCEPAMVQAALGLTEVRLSAILWGGGGGGSCGAVDLAAMAVMSGQAKAVVAVRSLAQGQTGRYGRYSAKRRHGSFIYPFGLLAAPQLLAMHVARYMHEHGVTQEQLGAFALACREHAQRNPAAVTRGRPLDMETYLSARIIADPLRLYDCCLETNGACAVLVTTWERARDLGAAPVPILSSAHGSSVGWSSGPLGAFNMPLESFATIGAASLANDLYGRAGVKPSDIDVAQIYDNFTGLALMAMEDYGLCPRGEAGAFSASGAIQWPHGALPVNTHGGNLSEAYIHGLNHVVEGVRQMRGTSTCQVGGAELCLVTGGPGPAPTSALILGRV